MKNIPASFILMLVSVQDIRPMGIEKLRNRSDNSPAIWAID
jgi:hypothetical protein